MEFLYVPVLIWVSIMVGSRIFEWFIEWRNSNAPIKPTIDLQTPSEDKHQS